MTYIINDNGIDREMTQIEIVDLRTSQAQLEVEQAAAEQAAADKAAAAASGRAKLAALGLTDDEINALLGA